MAQNGYPKWMIDDYIKLRATFKEHPFRIEDAVKVLGKSEESIMVLISNLRKFRLIEEALDPENPRKKIYSLKPIPVTRGDVESIMKKAADLIRTRVDYSFILLLLFYKRISDKWKLEFQETFNKLISEGYTEEEAKEIAKEKFFHQFDIPEEYLWDNIVKDKINLPQNFSKALKEIAMRNESLRPIFDNFDFNIFVTSRDNAEILRQLVELFDNLPLLDVSDDLLGDAYEWILMYFAPEKAKEGEVYTPREVIDLIVEILKPEPNHKVLDPAAGSGGMLIAAYKYIEKNYGVNEAKKLFLFGQEQNHKTAALARMNMYIHGIQNHQIETGDSLLYPRFELGAFNIVIANPPWNLDGYPEEVLKKNEKYKLIYKYGFTPSQSADWAWMQLMLAAVKDDGKVGVVIDNGALFRGGKEKTIRSRIIEEDLIEAVILLPEKLFYNTSAPGAIIILNKNKPEERKGKILFINASEEYEPHPDVKKLNKLGEKNIKKIVDAYDKFEDIEGFARVVDIKEIKENDYNLNVTLYVM
ncbi:MAG: SAM-dependent DNA methyltransferase, partial [Candidatus Thorarchaeota archaeon]